MHGLPNSGWWELLKDVIIPFLAILIPTVIAIRLSASERKAARLQREEERREALHDKAEQRRKEAVLAALDCMTELLKAGYTTDVQATALHSIVAAGVLSKVGLLLEEEYDPVWRWIGDELSEVVIALSDRDPELGIPVLLEQIRLRSAHFSNALVAWSSGEHDAQWFEDAETVAMVDTPPL